MVGCMKNKLKSFFVIMLAVSSVNLVPGSLVALAAPVQMVQTASPGIVRVHTPEDLKGSMNSSDRLYVIGDPVDLADYAKVIARNPHIVIILVDSSDNWERDRAIVGKELQNSELLRRVLTDPFTGLPDGIGVMRVNRKEKGKGTTEFHAAQRLADLGLSRDTLNNRFAGLKGKGYKIPEAISQVATEAQQAISGAESQAKDTVARNLDKARQDIAELKSMVATSGFRPVGLSDEVITAWMTKVDQGNAAFRKGDLRSSQAAAQEVIADVGRFSAEVYQLIARKERYDLAMRIITLLALLAVVTSVGVTAFIRRKAIEEVRSLADDANQDVTKAMDILSLSTYVGINATGRQKEETLRLQELSNALLEQSVIFQKFGDRADSVLKAKGFGWLMHHVFPFGVIYVNNLAKGNAALKVTQEDIQSLIAGSASLNKDYTVGSLDTKDLTVGDVKTLFDKTYPIVQDLLGRLEKADSKLKQGIEDLRADLEQLVEECQSLSALSNGNLFSEKPVTESIVLAVKHESSGHIAQAQRCLDQNDALGGIEGHIEPGTRIVLDGTKAVKVSTFGCEHVVPAMEQTSVALSASSDPLSTDWCGEFAQRASDELGRIIRLAPFQSIDSELDQQSISLEQLQGLYEEAQRLNQLRVSTWSDEYSTKGKEIGTSQDVVLAGLQKRGFFKSGVGDGIYREAGLSPKEELAKFEGALREIAEVLAVGNVERGKQLELAISQYQQTIAHLITASEKASADYAVTRTTLNTNAENAGVKVQVQQPFVQNASTAYSGYSQQRALESCGFGSGASSLDGAYAKAGRLIADSSLNIVIADQLMDRAAVLEAAQQHSNADRDLKEAVRIQEVIDLAITTLGEKAEFVRNQVSAAIEMRNSAVPAANQTGVRSNTRCLLAALTGKLTSCSHAVASEPYEVEEQLAGINQRIQKAIAMIQTDLELISAVNSTMADAVFHVSSATTAIANAGGVTFDYATVDLSEANGALDSYNSAVTEVSLLLAAEKYEAALEAANAANVSIQSVSGLVSDAISVAEQQNQDEIDQLAKIEADRLQAIKEAEEEEARQDEIDASATEDSDDEPDFSGTED